jgi:hypothetical protein
MPVKELHMNDDKVLFLVDSRFPPHILAYLVIRETPKMWKVKGLTTYAYDGQIHKEERNVRFTLADARELMREQLQGNVAWLEDDVRRTRDQLALVDTMEPEWRAGMKIETGA